MAKRLVACLLIFALCLPMGGCWSYRSLDQVTIVVGIAVDYDKEQNLFNIGFEAADLPGGAEESATAGKIILSQGKTMFDTVRNAKRRESDRLFFGGADVLVINQELARDMGVLGIIEWILRDGECRENMSVVISQEKTAKDILDGASEMNSIMSTIVDEIVREDKDVTATTYPMQLYEIYNSLFSPRRSALIPAVRKVQNGKDKVPELRL